MSSSPWTAPLLADLDAADKRATALAHELSVADLNWQPAPGRWSIGQCIDHLAITNEVYLAAIADTLTNAPVQPVGEITPGWFGRFFIRNYMEPTDKTRRAPAPGKIRPRLQVDVDVFDRFLRSNQHARKVIAQAGAHDVNRLRFRNPFVPLLRFSAGTGLLIITAHQRRHLLQAERVRKQLLAR